MIDAENWTIEYSSGIPIYKQIINWIFAEIGNGNFREGDRLPTIRELTKKLNINPNTIAKAYRDLDMKGVISSQRGSGSFIAPFIGDFNSLTKEDKQIKLNELFGRIITEAKKWQITENELLELTIRRLKEDE